MQITLFSRRLICPASSFYFCRASLRCAYTYLHLPEVQGECEKEDGQPSGAPLVDEAATTTVVGRPSSRHAELSTVSTRWGEDSGDDPPRVKTRASPPPQGAAIDHDDTPIEPSSDSRIPVSSSWGNDSSDDEGKSSATAPHTRVLSSHHAGAPSGPAGESTTWGADSDDDGDRKGDEAIKSRPSATYSMPSSSILAAAVGADENIAQGHKWSDDGDEESAAAGQRQQQQAEPAATSWGSDDEDDYEYPSSPALSQPFRMGAVAAGVEVSTAAALWGEDGEEGSSGGGCRHGPLPPIWQPARAWAEGVAPAVPGAALAGVNAHILSPGRHHHRDNGSGEVVMAPSRTPRAQQGQSAEPGEPNHWWADEGDESGSGGNGNGNGSPRATDCLNSIQIVGLQHPVRHATPRVFEDIDITDIDRASCPRAVDLATTYPGRAVETPTMAPSPWVGSLGRYFSRQPPSAGGGGGGGDGDSDRRYPWSFEPAKTPLRDGGLLGRWPDPDASLLPCSEPFGTKEFSPMHEALTRGGANRYQSPAISPVRARCSWFQRASRSVGWTRRRVVKEIGIPRTRDGNNGDNDNDSGVRAWGWRDNIRRAPGLAGRLAVCILAVCALWLTSLRVVGDNASNEPGTGLP